MHDLELRPFTLTSDDRLRTVHGRTLRRRDLARPAAAVVVVHGFKGFLAWGFFPELAERIARAGYVAVAANLSGSGVGEDLENFTDDEGFFHSTPSNDVEDVLRLLHHARTDDDVDEQRVALFGHSRGGGSALLAAERDGGVRAVVTWAAVSRTLRFPDELVADWRRTGVVEIPNARTGQLHRIGRGWLEDAEQNAAALDVEAACRRSSVPTLLVHGSADEAVPFEEGRALARALGEAGRLHAVEGAGHTFGAVHPYRGSTPALEEAFGVTLAFLEERL